jgi:hypothetical protein
MVGVILSDGEEDAHVQRPRRKQRPSAALLAHSEAAAIPSQQKRIEEFRAAEAARRAAEINAALEQVRNSTHSEPSRGATPSASTTGRSPNFEPNYT